MFIYNNQQTKINNLFLNKFYILFYLDFLFFSFNFNLMLFLFFRIPSKILHYAYSSSLLRFLLAVILFSVTLLCLTLTVLRNTVRYFVKCASIVICLIFFSSLHWGYIFGGRRWQR